MFSLGDYDYRLPEELIAQIPASKREASRLLTLDRQTGDVLHRSFEDLINMFDGSEVLVVNDTQVVPARLIGCKKTGGRVEILVLDYHEGLSRIAQKGESVFKCLVKSSKRPRTGSILEFDQGLSGEILDDVDGICRIHFSAGADFEEWVDRAGRVPLPPYIRRGEEPCWDDRTSYQTVYARCKGAVAAPTAGLHFSKCLLEKLESKGVKIVAITLHVGYGTFFPVRVSDIREHAIHSEWYSVSEATARCINRARADGARIVAAGTTSVRTLEYAADDRGQVVCGSGYCDLFIYPGYRFKVVDAMITNFHLPKSTLLMLVSAFAGRCRVLEAYEEAIRKRYRFYSYGDAMYIF